MFLDKPGGIDSAAEIVLLTSLPSLDRRINGFRLLFNLVAETLVNPGSGIGGCGNFAKPFQPDLGQPLLPKKMVLNSPDGRFHDTATS